MHVPLEEIYYWVKYESIFPNRINGRQTIDHALEPKKLGYWLRARGQWGKKAKSIKADPCLGLGGQTICFLQKELSSMELSLSMNSIFPLSLSFMELSLSVNSIFPSGRDINSLLLSEQYRWPECPWGDLTLEHPSVNQGHYLVWDLQSNLSNSIGLHPRFLTTTRYSLEQTSYFKSHKGGFLVVEGKSNDC